MKEYQTTDLLPGMITAEPIRTKTGQVVIRSNVALTTQLIERIAFYNIERAKIADSVPRQTHDVGDNIAKISSLHYEQKSATPGKGAVAEPSYSHKIKKSREFQQFQLDFTFSANDLKQVFDRIIAGETLDSTTLLKKVVSLIQPGQNTIEFFDMLHNLRQVNDSIYAHCINVSLISRMIGVWLKLPKADMDALTLAGLLHDIGKTSIPADLLNKKEKLTDDEFAIIRRHPQFGYELLKNLSLDERILNAALMHHERCDGSGYPAKLTTDIDDFALIVAIADVYDAMTAARAYRAPLCPFQVIAEFEKEGLQKYKPKYILTFLEHIATTYQNNRVMLSDGASAKIVLLNHHVFSKPLVQLNDGSCLDLNRSSLYIKAMI